MLSKRDRYEWIIAYIETKSDIGYVDILNSDFVMEYINKFEMGFVITMYGAYKCKQLGQDLSYMNKAGLLSRSTIGISNPQMGVTGFPRWVYVYKKIVSSR